MKKIVLSMVGVAAIAITMVACQNNSKGPENSGQDTTAAQTTTASVDTMANVKMATGGNGAEILSVSPDAKLEAPKFSSEEVNEGFAKFEPLRQEYAKAVESKNATKIKELTAQYNAWVKEASAWGAKLTKDENQIYIDHYTKLTTQWDKLTQKAKK